MAVTRIIKRSDDLGGAGEASEVIFSINGKAYSVDLNKRNLETFERHLSKYTNVARPLAQASPDVSVSEVRAWAQDNGYSVSDRGRVPISVMDAYLAENPSTN